MRPEDRIRERAEALRAAAQWRDPAAALTNRSGAGEGTGIEVDARSNDYLGLAREVVSRETVDLEVSAGAGASRLISGTLPEHLELEARLAEWLQVESTLLFSSGYAANLGVVSSLGAPGDVVFSDALNHASLIDGCRLGKARVVVIPHLDLAALEARLAEAGPASARWVVTESYFGMDGDVPDLGALRQLCDRYAAGLIVDEAHALGVFGPEGRGLCAEAGIQPDLLVGGMGKGLGAQGGFVAASSTFRGWLWNRARSFVFSTAPSPMICRLALQQLRRLREAEEPRRRLRELELRLEQQLLDGGVPLAPGRRGPLFPIVFGSERRTLAAADALLQSGVASHAIRPPTVPPGSSRLRVTLRANMTDRQLQRLGSSLVAVWRSTPPLLPAAAPIAPGAPPIPGSTAPGPLPPAVDSAVPPVPGSAVPAPRSVGVDPAASARPSPGQAESDAAARAPRSSLGEQTVGAGPARRDAISRAGRGAVARRWIVLGTGTDVGKSFVAEALVRLLAARAIPVAGLKPIETGLVTAAAGATALGDAARLQQASFHVKHPVPHPLFAFPDPLTPSLAARRACTSVELERVPTWVEQVRADGSELDPHLVIETAGGVFSPLNDLQDNLDLAVALGPAEWILVAPDRLGTLHDVLGTLRAMESTQRAPDWLILSAVRDPDASSGTNAAELRRRNITPRIISLGRDETAPLELILEHPSPADPSSAP